jgi:hypothetical protein
MRKTAALPAKAVQTTNKAAKKINSTVKKMTTQSSIGMTTMGSTDKSPGSNNPNKPTLTVHSVPLRTGEARKAIKVTRKKA